MSGCKGSPTLVLIPTAAERRRIEDQGGLDPGLALVHVCGFGPVASAARTAELLARLRPAHVVLVGIAGTFDEARLPVGSALAFDSVAIEGIGAGEGERLVGPAALGFPQWPGGEVGEPARVDDSILLAGRSRTTDAGTSGGPVAQLLTTCAASASPDQARLRRARHPQALAEDMEGYAVALACALANVPVSIVRGASNVVGDRDPSRWRIPAALAAARERAIELLLLQRSHAT